MSKIKVSARLVPPGGSEGKSVPCSSSSSWWFLRIPDVPWLTDASLLTNYTYKDLTFSGPK